MADCIYCAQGIVQWIEAPGRAPEHLLPIVPAIRNEDGSNTVGRFVPCNSLTAALHASTDRMDTES